MKYLYEKWFEFIELWSQLRPIADELEAVREHLTDGAMDNDMSTKILIQPTEEILGISTLVDELIHHFLDISLSSIPFSGEFESHDEAYLQMALAVRNIEGVLLLANHDLVLLPAALNLARSAFEVAARSNWLVHSSEPFECEDRWLVHMQGEERFLTKLSRRLQEHGKDASPFLSRRDIIQDFRERVTAVLPDGYEPLTQLPKFNELLEEIGHGDKYIEYMKLSQNTHGTHAGTSLYRKDLGNLKKIGEFIEPGDWYSVFIICWLCLAQFGVQLIESLGGNSSLFLENSLIEDTHTEISSLNQG